MEGVATDNLSILVEMQYCAEAVFRSSSLSSKFDSETGPEIGIMTDGAWEFVGKVILEGGAPNRPCPLLTDCDSFNVPLLVPFVGAISEGA